MPAKLLNTIGKAPGVPHSHTKPYVPSKGRKGQRKKKQQWVQRPSQLSCS